MGTVGYLLCWKFQKLCRVARSTLATELFAYALIALIQASCALRLSMRLPALENSLLLQIINLYLRLCIRQNLYAIAADYELK